MSYVLVHSPLVGPATWAPVAKELAERGMSVQVPSLLTVADSEPPHWRHAIQSVAASVKGHGPVVIAGHSGAGALLPAIAQSFQRPVRCYVFVDAQLPPISGDFRTDSPFLEQLRSMVTNGRLPRWSTWWGSEVMRNLVPDDKIRAEIEAELPELPLSYFEEAVPVPSDWDRAPVAYLRLSHGYQPQAEEARSRGYLVDDLEGGHLHLVVDPVSVADRIIGLVAKLT